MLEIVILSGGMSSRIGHCGDRGQVQDRTGEELVQERVLHNQGQIQNSRILLVRYFFYIDSHSGDAFDEYKHSFACILTPQVQLGQEYRVPLTASNREHNQQL